MMVWAEVILSEKLLLVFRCFTNKMVLFGFAKSKAINFSFEYYFDRSIYVTSRGFFFLYFILFFCVLHFLKYDTGKNNKWEKNLYKDK